MTYEESGVDQTIDRLLREHPDLDTTADGALDDLDQFHIGGADAVDLLIDSLALTEGDGSWTSGRDSADPPGRSPAAPATTSPASTSPRPTSTPPAT